MIGTFVVAVVATGCGSGTDSVPVPGADAVVTAPADSIDVVRTTDTTDATGSTTATTASPSPNEVATTEVASTTTSAPPPETAGEPGEPEAPTTDPPPATVNDDIYLSLGDEGPEVATMQRKLASIDYLPDGSDTGVFDETTRAGLRRFQGDYGLGVDGVFGPITGRSLNAAVSSINPGG